jgi:hypothetical protein
MRCNIKFWMQGFFALAIMFGVLRGNAQEFRATLTGQVTDPTGALIKGATVTLVNNDSKTTYTAITTAKGGYYIPYVLPGSYTVTVTAGKFKTAEQDQVVLSTAQTFNQNFKLELGSIDQSVVVTSAPPQLETSTGSGGTILGQRELENVPVNGGQAYMLIGTTPGSQFTTTSFGAGVGNSGTRGWDVTNSVLFGGPDTNPGDGAASYSATSGWSGFGTVGAQQQNFPRILQISGKISF